MNNPVSCPPRLLDLEAAATYLGLSSWTIRDLIANGTLKRVQVPLPDGQTLRKVLLDREDLDRLVTTWKT
jgi:excisionase family DNA binding protein